VKFHAAAEYGYPAQLAVAAFLNAKGIGVRVPPLQFERPDVGDVLDEHGRTFEVQRRTVSFAGRSTFPWPNMLALQREKERQGLAIRACFSVSADLAVAAIANYEQTREFWFEQVVPHQSVPGTTKLVLMCPLELVKFARLPKIDLGEKRCCVCGGYATRSVDNGETWRCWKHELAKQAERREGDTSVK
jgi:hypothetical protein